MRVLIGGSHGLVGTKLVERLEADGDEVVRLSRNPESEQDVRLDPKTGPVDIREFELFDAVIHLGGASIGEKRWSAKEKEKLWDSRVLSTEAIVKTFSQVINKPKTFICASATGYYGDQGDTELTEQSPNGEGFLASLCKEWEEVACEARNSGQRVATLRSGVVFSPDGGALKRQLPLFKLGIAGRLGTGNQWMSWIDIDDEVEAIVHILRDDKLEGPFNLTSPNPITNDDFTDLLGTVLRRPTWIPAPRWMIALALGGEITDELLLASQRAIPQKLIDSGFEFKHPNAAESLVRLLAPDDLHLLQSEDKEFELPPRPVLDVTDKNVGNGNDSGD